jgi:hypothetical protein
MLRTGYPIRSRSRTERPCHQLQRGWYRRVVPAPAAVYSFAAPLNNPNTLTFVLLEVASLDIAASKVLGQLVAVE